MTAPTLAEFKAWVQARQLAACNAIPVTPSEDLPDLFKRGARASTVIREIEVFTDALEKEAPCKSR